MLIVGAVNNLVILQRVITAFWGNTGQSAADFLNETNVTSNFIESTSWFLQVTLGDAFMVRSRFLQWNKSERAGVFLMIGVDVSVLDLVWETMVGTGSPAHDGTGNLQ